MLIEIKYAGICHSDIHTVRGDWGPQTYPPAPGHETTGILTEIGSAVTKRGVGDRVGVGCTVISCGECPNCRAGQEQYCLAGTTGTYGAVDRDGTITHGGYSTHVVVTEEHPAASLHVISTERTTMTTIAIVGAGWGLGAAVARRFGREGFSLALISRSQNRVDTLAADFDPRGGTAARDVRDPAALTAALEQAADGYRAMDERRAVKALARP